MRFDFKTAFRALPALLLGASLATPLYAQENCQPGVMWTYTGTAAGTPTIKDTGKAVLIEFAPKGANATDSIVFSSVNPSGAGVYQVNADVDVNHLSDDATFNLEGATSAAAGRPFEVNMAQGDGGSSGFSRPINTTGQPFTVQLRTKASNKISIKIRNFVVCKLR
jgi:hypothetical protein